MGPQSMEPSFINGYKILSEIGVGCAGTVYEVEGKNGEICALKVYDMMSSNAGLLASRVKRVIDGGAQHVTVPVIEQALEERPSYLVMPLMGKRAEGGEASFQPQTLQTSYADYETSELTWPFLVKLATRLASLHTAKVAHGNLKPGNIFLEEDGGPLLSDYASGLMPGVHRIGYSDALLYAPPEQLRFPDGYHEEAGYRWDVYAFGVLAYRLLTGKFPRCHEVFNTVSPAPGTQQRFGIEADYQGIVEGLEGSGDLQWPTEAQDEREARRREVVIDCLSLDPLGRPSNMREVSRHFENLEIDLSVREENERLLTSEKKAQRKKRGMAVLLGLTSVAALGLGAAWMHSQKMRISEEEQARVKLEQQRELSESAMAALRRERDDSLAGKKEAMRLRDELQESLSAEQGKSQFEIASVQETNEALFNWILAEGVENLPVLEGRAERLSYLAEKLDEQLEGLKKRPELAEHAALLRLRKAELALARGDVRGGKDLLEDAIDQGNFSEKYLARARMRLFLISSKLDPANLETLIKPTEDSIEAAWGNDKSLSLRAKAAMELGQARMWNAKGDRSRAEVEFLASLKSYKELAQLYPENPAVALLVGKRYLSAASAAEGEGAFENAAVLRAEAAAAFSELAKKQKSPSPELEYQIASASAARAVTQWQQGDTFGAEALAREGVAKLRSLQAKLPNDFRVTLDLASQQGIIATALRDEGKPKEAQAILTESIKSLEAGLKGKPEEWSGRYLLASLKWQLAGLMGQQGESDSELEMGAVARDELRALLASDMVRPRPSEVRRSLAYLCADLGYSADLRNKRELAVTYLEEAKRLWQELARDEGDQLEIRQGYHSANNRLEEMGVE